MTGTTGKCPSCGETTFRPEVKIAETNTAFSDLPMAVVLIQCAQCHVVLGAQIDPRLQADLVKRAMLTADVRPWAA